MDIDVAAGHIMGAGLSIRLGDVGGNIDDNDDGVILIDFTLLILRFKNTSHQYIRSISIYMPSNNNNDERVFE